MEEQAGSGEQAVAIGTTISPACMPPGMASFALQHFLTFWLSLVADPMSGNDDDDDPDEWLLQIMAWPWCGVMMMMMISGQ